MSKKTGILKGIPGVQAACVADVTIWSAIRMAHLENPNRTLVEIAESAQRIFGIQGVPVKTLTRTYYRLEASFLNESIIEQ